MVWFRYCASHTARKEISYSWYHFSGLESVFTGFPVLLPKKEANAWVTIGTGSVQGKLR